MSDVRETDLSRVRTVPIAARPNKVRAEEFCAPPGDDRSFAAFVRALPDVLVARDFRAVVEAIAAAARARKGVIVMLGGHIVKTGLAPVLIDLMRRGVITHLAMNGSAAIHDFEMARFGGTSEDVAAGLRDGSFGMAEETGRELNEAFVRGSAAQRERSFGDAAAAFDREATGWQRAGHVREMALALARAGAAWQADGRSLEAADRLYRAARSLFAQGDAVGALQRIEPALTAAKAAQQHDLATRIVALFEEIKQNVAHGAEAAQ